MEWIAIIITFLFAGDLYHKNKQLKEQNMELMTRIYDLEKKMEEHAHEPDFFIKDEITQAVNDIDILNRRINFLEKWTNAPL